MASSARSKSPSKRLSVASIASRISSRYARSTTYLDAHLHGDLHHRPNLDRSVLRAGNTRRNGHGLIEILRLDLIVAAELLARFGEGTVRGLRLAFADADRGRRVHRGERVAADVVAAAGDALGQRAIIGEHRAALRLGHLRIILLVAVDEAEVLHHRLRLGFIPCRTGTPGIDSGYDALASQAVRNSAKDACSAKCCNKASAVASLPALKTLVGVLGQSIFIMIVPRAGAGVRRESTTSGGTGASCTCLYPTEYESAPSNGGNPSSISYSMTPKA